MASQVSVIRGAPQVSALMILQEAGDLDFNTYPIWTAKLNETVALVAIDGFKSKHWSQLASEYLHQHSSIVYNSEYRKKKLLIVATRSVGRLTEAVFSYQPDTTKADAKTKSRIFGSAESQCEPNVLKMFICKDDFFQEVRHSKQAENYFRTEMRKVLG